ncbi:SprT family zinc-dependent metalloprotease [Thermococcus atlanticus]
MRSINLNGREVSYEVIRRRVKYLRIHVMPEGYLRIVSPTDDVEEVIREKENWILRKLALFDGIPQEAFEKFPLFGSFYEVERGDETGIYKNRICYRDLSPLGRFLRTLLKKKLLKLIGSYSPLIGRTPSRVFIRKNRSRWGSCSSRGNLSFNLMAVSLPVDLIDYLVVHELAHLIELSHSKAFWSIVSQFHPDYRKKREELRVWWLTVWANPLWRLIMEG